MNYQEGSEWLLQKKIKHEELYACFFSHSWSTNPFIEQVLPFIKMYAFLSYISYFTKMTFHRIVLCYSIYWPSTVIKSRWLMRFIAWLTARKYFELFMFFFYRINIIEIKKQIQYVNIISISQPLKKNIMVMS